MILDNLCEMLIEDLESNKRLLDKCENISDILKYRIQGAMSANRYTLMLMRSFHHADISSRLIKKMDELGIN